MKPTIAIAMSGGVDSLVSAYLLKEAGTPVFGIHFTTGFESPREHMDCDPLYELGSQLGISIHTVDLSRVFREEVVDYFIRTYREGKTPNPCLVCNPMIKFGELLTAAKKMGADLLATGHYARISQGNNGRYELLRGLDRRKDQSYFLGFLSQHQLSQACFPLGEMTKDETIALAEEKGLKPVTRSESQDVCFIHEKTYGDFLEKYGGMTPDPGPVVTLDGDIVGRHPGLHMFTIGQRRGINCPSSEPFYVLRLEIDTNTLVVGRKPDLASKSCIVERLNWIDSPPDFPVTVDVRLRYRHQAVPATIVHHGPGMVMVRFSSPQEAATPGQGAVFYMEDRVVCRHHFIMKRFIIKTLGCRVNQSESETIAASLRKEGFSELKPTQNPEASGIDTGPVSVCIVNTCTVTEKASMQSRQAIRQVVRTYPAARIIVTGCYAETQPEEIRQIKGVHEVIPQAEKLRIVSAILPCMPDSPRQLETPWPDALLFTPEEARGSRTRAVLKIQDGCNAHCTYCIVPAARGRSRSMPEAQVISNLNGLHRAGYNEVVLSGIHLGSYGLDLHPESSLFTLLGKIDRLGIIKRVRLSSIEPGELSNEIIALVAHSDHFCRHFHIPLQSGDDAVLKKMRRFYTRSFFANLVHGIHQKIPDAAIGLDVLVGFPGETDAAFENTFALVEALPVAYLHVFPFSPRKSTPAYNMQQQVSPSIIKTRAAQMRTLGGKKRRAFYDALVGGTLEVLVEGPVDRATGWVKGRTSNYVPVFLEDYAGKGNHFVTVKIKKRLGDRGVLACPISYPAAP